MKVIQLIGPPCSGKTHLIKEFILTNYNRNIISYDIAETRFRLGSYWQNWNGLFATMINDGLREDHLVIVESVCGEHHLDSLNINLTTDLQLFRHRHLLREIELTDKLLNYYSQLETQALPKHLTIHQGSMYSFVDYGTFGQQQYSSSAKALQGILDYYYSYNW